MSTDPMTTDPMTTRGRVMVTGAGGPAGVAVIRDLEQRGVPTLAVDCDPSAVGLRLATAGAVLPRADHPAYGRRLCAMAEDEKVAALVVTVADEFAPVHAVAAELGDLGVHLWLPDPTAVHRCLDKWAFHQHLGATHPLPATTVPGGPPVPGPWVVKPRFGRGSRDVILVDTEDELAWAVGRVPDPVIQTRLSGREFTIDVLTDRAGDLVGAVPRWRLETRGGISTSGRTFADAELVASAGALLRSLGFCGVANVQGFVAEDGSHAFVEVNPRFSGGLPLSLAAGADLVGQYLVLAAGGRPDPERLRFTEGVSMLRYFAEVFEE